MFTVILDYALTAYFYAFGISIIALINKEYYIFFVFFLFFARFFTKTDTAGWFFISWSILMFLAGFVYLAYKIRKK